MQQPFEATSFPGAVLLLLGICLFASGIVATKYLSEIHLAAIPLVVNAMLAIVSALACFTTGASLLPLITGAVLAFVLLQAGTLIALQVTL